ncbi:unnamed protein product [Rotaria magnacalcarata]|uniref:Tetratricopeptide repeat protein n=2 Tax=Rotaria magnacalcarata TaxID=392030 RepID=A0A816NRF2_9BILA|nr:unnamed protein product [Rotaria magnacalcarata]CAF1547559.1 unnamed protein product [Rotaria magnacalcarata]CAF2038877.1 unnamed protein product [Rotaria magnacalcarata]CAF2158454.1 unnamed protein product [Rotaria magnacalcarata]CAF4221452.1 unnamed protein product [Rotaria magnacalcarata]
MSDEHFKMGEVEADKENYAGAIECFNKVIQTQNEETKKDFVILHHKRRAECYYKLNNYVEALKDLNQAISKGFDVTESEKYFFMLNHCKLQSDLDNVIDNIERQGLLHSSWDCHRRAMLLKGIRYANIFIGKGIRERSQSADRNKGNRKH